MSNTPDISQDWFSDCHHAPVRVVGGGEGTNHWECTLCSQSCNAIQQVTGLVPRDSKPAKTRRVSPQGPPKEGE